MSPDPTGAPGADLVLAGLADLRAGLLTVPALLVCVGAPRLRELGFDVPPGPPEPEHRLYLLLGTTEGHNAHSAYNALLRRLVSFERTLERRRSHLPVGTGTRTP